MDVIGHFQAAPLCQQKKNPGTIWLLARVRCKPNWNFGEKKNVSPYWRSNSGASCLWPILCTEKPEWNCDQTSCLSQGCCCCCCCCTVMTSCRRRLYRQCFGGPFWPHTQEKMSTQWSLPMSIAQLCGNTAVTRKHDGGKNKQADCYHWAQNCTWQISSQYNTFRARYVVLTAVWMKIHFLWEFSVWRFSNSYRRFGRSYCLHLLGPRTTSSWSCIYDGALKCW
jgi:hypothetical protein